MSELWITLPSGHKVTFMQAVRLSALLQEHAPAHWHMNECGCCLTVHPDGDCTRGYVVSQDGEFDYLEMGRN